MKLEERAFEKLKRYVESELEFSISYYNDEYLKRRIKSRMRRSKRTNLEDYYQYLKSNTNEQEKLLRSFSINVTGFFRNQDVWAEIRTLLQELTTENNTCRVWSAGCADGREPYSIALLGLTDPEIDETALQIVGTDINTEALEKARKGCYKDTITNDVHEQLSFLTDPFNYVSRREDKMIVDEQIREMVDFVNHDLIREQPTHEFDLVLCRNVLIYLKRDHEQDIFNTITSGMREGGYIVIGKAETLPGSLKPSFDSIDAGLRVYQYTGHSL